MNGSGHPRFRLLIGWCCLLSAAILVMTVYLTAFNKQVNINKTEPSTPYNDQQRGLPPGQSVRNYIRYIWDDHNHKSWICSPPCDNSSFSMQNNTLKIAVSGFYYINAQVCFIKQNLKPNQHKQELKRTITLIRNEGNGKSQRKLSEVIRYEDGSMSLNRVVHLMEGESITLTINHDASMMLSTEDWETYWEIISL